MNKIIIIKYTKEIDNPEIKNSFVSKNKREKDINTNIMVLDTKLAKFAKVSEFLGISWISIDKNFDWFAYFKEIYSWLTIFWNATEDIFALIEAAIRYCINSKNTLKTPQKITVTKNLAA